MAFQKWSPAALAALRRLRAAGATIDRQGNPSDGEKRALGAAAAELYAAVPDPGPDGELPPVLAEVRLLAGSLMMAVRHDALGSMALADTIERLSELIGS